VKWTDYGGGGCLRANWSRQICGGRMYNHTLRKLEITICRKFNLNTIRSSTKYNIASEAYLIIPDGGSVSMWPFCVTLLLVPMPFTVSQSDSLCIVTCTDSDWPITFLVTVNTLQQNSDMSFHQLTVIPHHLNSNIYSALTIPASRWTKPTRSANGREVKDVSYRPLF
jgi:hypothetical protein